MRDQDERPRERRHAGAVSPDDNADELRPRSCDCEHNSKDVEDDYHPTMMPQWNEALSTPAFVTLEPVLSA
jgi:hypothetical protein